MSMGCPCLLVRFSSWQQCSSVASFLKELPMYRAEEGGARRLKSRASYATGSRTIVLGFHPRGLRSPLLV